MNHAAGIRIRCINASMQGERFACAVTAHLYAIDADLGESLWLEETQACFRGGDEKSVRQANANVARGGMDVATLEERAAYATDLLPQF
jgi:hypothetical protein